ncbi:efflux RND transporter periplasmic adaptor subunit [Crateriforma conspicua]|uniref:Putative efflux pump membrane fusion protein n=1 Tax=Crateriforma conspicua TaxID=2527996 RepID=A0A5C5YAT8_9PLAN|nr:HlyD family efflux transporter periplasmic adaptor subunit [Crateriforma conspicua]QDV61509.1 putative efflux pump membrane fusion protein [Crateriforma conspicua]TWT72244.1 putative efflux pump membrane fusion protein [Crateriforma conspicua]
MSLFSAAQTSQCRSLLPKAFCDLDLTGCTVLAIMSCVFAGHVIGQTPPESSVSASPSPESTTTSAIIRVDAQTSLIQNTTLASPISGIIQSIHVREGDSIEPAALMVQFADEEINAEYQAAKAAYEAAVIESRNDVDARYAQRSLDVHQQELQKSQQANQRFAGAISGTEIERLQLVVDQSTLAIEQADQQREIATAKAKEKLAAVRLIETRLTKHHYQSPIGGRVAEVMVEPGQWVEQGKPLVRVISLNPIRVECFVDGQRYGDELLDAKVEFRLRATSMAGGATPSMASAATPMTASSGPETWTGNVTFVSPELHPVTGQTRLWARIDNPDRRLRAGMKGTMSIEMGPVPR